MSDLTRPRAMGWSADTRLEFRLVDGLIIIRAQPHSPYALTGRGHLRLPLPVRRWCALAPGDRVLLAADPTRARLVVHPPAALEQMLRHTHARLPEQAQKCPALTVTARARRERLRSTPTRQTPGEPARRRQAVHEPSRSMPRRNARSPTRAFRAFIQVGGSVQERRLGVVPPRAEPTQVNVCDFINTDLGKAVPYGVYDLAANTGWVGVGTDPDTAAFAVATITTQPRQLDSAVQTLRSCSARSLRSGVDPLNRYRRRDRANF